MERSGKTPDGETCFEETFDFGCEAEDFTEPSFVDTRGPAWGRDGVWPMETRAREGGDSGLFSAVCEEDRRSDQGDEAPSSEGRKFPILACAEAPSGVGWRGWVESRRGEDWVDV